MGRHRWTSRLTVEECPLCLCVASFCRDGLFAYPAGTNSKVWWTDTVGCATLGRLECRLEDNGTTGLAIYIRRQLARIDVFVDQQTIPVTTVRPHLGGKRFWFLCGCGRRVGRLYLAPGQRGFACRFCNDLTYTSSRRHDPRESRKRAALRAVFRAELEACLEAVCLQDLEEYIRLCEEQGLAISAEFQDCPRQARTRTPGG